MNCSSSSLLKHSDHCWMHVITELRLSRSLVHKSAHLLSSVGVSPGTSAIGVAGSRLGCSGDAMGTGLGGNGLQGLGLPNSDAGEPSACCASQERHRRTRRLPLHFCALGRPGRRPKHLARSCSNSDVRRPAETAMAILSE